jgi:hypothetical protein
MIHWIIKVSCLSEIRLGLSNISIDTELKFTIATMRLSVKVSGRNYATI